MCCVFPRFFWDVPENVFAYTGILGRPRNNVYVPEITVMDIYIYIYIYIIIIIGLASLVIYGAKFEFLSIYNT